MTGFLTLDEVRGATSHQARNRGDVRRERWSRLASLLAHQQHLDLSLEQTAGQLGNDEPLARAAFDGLVEPGRSRGDIGKERS